MGIKQKDSVSCFLTLFPDLNPACISLHRIYGLLQFGLWLYLSPVLTQSSSLRTSPGVVPGQSPGGRVPFPSVPIQPEGRVYGLQLQHEAPPPQPGPETDSRSEPGPETGSRSIRTRLRYRLLVITRPRYRLQVRTRHRYGLLVRTRTRLWLKTMPKTRLWVKTRTRLWDKTRTRWGPRTGGKH